LRIRSLVIWVALALLLSACATPQTRALLQDSHLDSLPPVVELEQVPFFPQEDHQCGPASLATALSAAGIKTDPANITQQVYLPGREGSLQVEMLAAARRNGAVPYLLKPDLREVLAEVRSGTPVVILQNLGLSWYPVWHYAVIIGYDLPNGNLLLRSGKEHRQVLALTTFERTWARSNYWAFVALPPGKLPVTATEDGYLASVVSMESLGLIHHARVSYAAALERWPESLTAAIGLGNTAFALKDMDAAEAAFLRASRDHPESAIAHNNLAHVLAKRARYNAALTAARRAIELGGPHAAEARRTLSDIETAMHR